MDKFELQLFDEMRRFDETMADIDRRLAEIIEFWRE